MGCLCGLLGMVLLTAAVPVAPASGSQKVRIVSVEGKRSLRLGEKANYIIHINPDAAQPIDYYWDAGAGVFIQGRSVVLEFDQAGEYALTVTARNRYGSATKTLTVTVTGAPAGAPRAALPDTALRAATPGATPSSRRNTQPSPPTGFQRAALYGAEGIALNQGGYTWVVETHLSREQAVIDVRNYRVAGYRVELLVDDEGEGSTAYRVIMGLFATEQAALLARRYLPKDIPGGTLLRALPDTRAGDASQ